MGAQRKAKTKEIPREQAAATAPSGPIPLLDRDDPEPRLDPDPTTPGDYVGPPLHGKTDPREAMDFTSTTLDDEHRNYHHHPSETGTTEFAFDPLAGDAAADLAGDFGAQFLEGATRGEDLSEEMFAHEDADDAEADLLLEEDREEEADSEFEEEPAPPPPPPPIPIGRRKTR